jgi:hypothetical protein
MAPARLFWTNSVTDWVIRSGCYAALLPSRCVLDIVRRVRVPRAVRRRCIAGAFGAEPYCCCFGDYWRVGVFTVVTGHSGSGVPERHTITVPSYCWCQLSLFIVLVVSNCADLILLYPFVPSYRPLPFVD